MKSRQGGDVITMVAGEALTKNRFVDFEGKHTVDLAALGVTLFDADSGETASVQVSGIAVVEAGGSITAGNWVKSDANGKALANTLSAVADVAKICGTALDDGSDGTYIRVKLGL